LKEKLTALRKRNSRLGKAFSYACEKRPKDLRPQQKVFIEIDKAIFSDLSAFDSEMVLPTLDGKPDRKAYQIVVKYISWWKDHFEFLFEVNHKTQDMNTFIKRDIAKAFFLLYSWPVCSDLDFIM
jgi:hypothetical protein